MKFTARRCPAFFLLLAEQGRARLATATSENGIEITLPTEAPDKIATVIELRGKFTGSPK